MKINNFRGDPSDTSAKMATLNTVVRLISCNLCAYCLPIPFLYLHFVLLAIVPAEFVQFQETSRVATAVNCLYS